MCGCYNPSPPPHSACRLDSRGRLHPPGYLLAVDIRYRSKYIIYMCVCCCVLLCVGLTPPPTPFKRAASTVEAARSSGYLLAVYIRYRSKYVVYACVRV